MTDTTEQIYYAITGCGWGRGSTPEEAKAKYLQSQKHNWPHIKGEDLDEFWGFVWEAPEGATGFYADSEVHWKFEDGTSADAEPSQRVHTIGNVPVRMFAKSN